MWKTYALFNNVELSKDSKGTRSFQKFTNRYHISKQSYNLLRNASKRTLFIVSHRYEHVDVFALCPFLKIFKPNYYIVAHNAWWNKIHKPLNQTTNLYPIYTGSGIVKKAINKLNDGDNVVSFYYEHQKSTGIFHIAKDTGCDVLMVNIKCRNAIEKNHTKSSVLEIFMGYFNEDIDIECKYYDGNRSSGEGFVEGIKKHLYKS